MRMLVLGAGLQGCACAYDLLQHPGVERVTVADLKLDRFPAFLESLVGKRLALVKLDVRDAAALRDAMRAHDAVLNAAPYHFNLEVSKAAVEVGVHCADLGGNTEIVFQQRKLDAAATQRKVSVVPDCGLAPGMVNILAAEGIRRVGEADVVKIYVGGLPQHPEPPLNYQIDRKSTRLNSSHLVISYAVFCLKKKKNNAERNMSITHDTIARDHMNRIWT